MSWESFLLAAAAFLAGFAVHVALWRFRRPSDDLRALAAVILVGPALLATAGGTFLLPESTGTETAFAALGALSLGLAYLCWYPAAQAASPTMVLTLLAGRAGDRGVTRREMEAALPEDRLVNEGLENLFHERFARIDPEGRLWLDKRGRRTLYLIRSFRRGCGFRDPHG